MNKACPFCSYTDHLKEFEGNIRCTSCDVQAPGWLWNTRPLELAIAEDRDRIRYAWEFAKEEIEKLQSELDDAQAKIAELIRTSS